MEQNIDPAQVKDQIISNLLSAGILLHNETNRFRSKLEELTFDELLKVLLVSHELREQYASISVVVVGPICLN